MNSDEALVKLAEVVGQSTGETISQYSAWHLSSALCWILFGILLAASSRLIPDFGEDAVFSRWIAVGLVWFVAALFIFANIPDVISPKAVAINQLIKDIRG